MRIHSVVLAGSLAGLVCAGAIAEPGTAPVTAASPAAAARTAPEECIDIAGLVPGDVELPAGWSIESHASEAPASPSQGISLLLGRLRRAGLAPIAETEFGVATPEGSFRVAYALLPERADADETLRSAVTGSGVGARMTGRVLFLATTADRPTLSAMADRMMSALSLQLKNAAATAEESGNSARFLQCASDYVAAFPDHAPAHLMIAEHLLFRTGTPRPEEAIVHLESALSPAGQPPLSAVERSRALYDQGVAESLLGRGEESIKTLRAAEASAPGPAEKADAQYQLAASLAMLDRRTEAVAVLRRCFDNNRLAGREVPSRAAASDVAFVSLRDDETFRQLVGAPSPSK